VTGEEGTVIRARGLVKRFKSRGGEVMAIDGVDLAVGSGEIFGLIGPDGAGKTTSLRVILGLLSRTEGESAILGYDSMRDTYAIRERVGYIAQQFALPGELTVAENMRFFADMHGVAESQRRQRIPQLLEFAGLTAFTDRLANKLSGGMKKKLALACSLIHEPRVLMLDEPTLGVDPVSRRDFWSLLSRLRVERGATVLVCTPYMDEAERCNRVALIYAGQLVACDTPQRIKGRLPGELIELHPEPFRRAREGAADLPGVLEVQTYGRALHLVVDDADRRGEEIVSALEAQGIACQRTRPIEPRMEEAFVSLIRAQRGEPREGR